MKNNGFNVRREQRKSLLFKEVCLLFSQLSADEKAFEKIYPTRLELSPGNGACFIYFSSMEGEEGFKAALESLKLYRPSLRKAISNIMQSRYTPEIIFKYDEELEKELRIQTLIEKIKTEDSEEE